MPQRHVFSQMYSKNGVNDPSVLIYCIMPGQLLLSSEKARRNPNFPTSSWNRSFQETSSKAESSSPSKKGKKLLDSSDGPFSAKRTQQSGPDMRPGTSQL